jgi:hypothetical protein
MPRFPLVVGVVLSAALLPDLAHAQVSRAPSVELGIDAGVAYDTDRKVTVVGLPAQRFRVGFFANPHLSIEPIVSLNYAGDGDDSFTQFTGDLGVLAHFTADPEAPQAYVRPFIGVSALGDGSDSISQLRFGGGLGVKMPVADRLAFRLEGVFARSVENDDFPASNAIGLNVGLSFLVR